MKARSVRVICYDGQRAGQEPVWLVEGDHRTRVENIIDRWHQGPPRPGPPIMTYYRIRLADGREKLLRHIPLFDDWAEVLPARHEIAPHPTPPPRGKAVVIPFPAGRIRGAPDRNS